MTKLFRYALLVFAVLACHGVSAAPDKKERDKVIAAVIERVDVYQSKDIPRIRGYLAHRVIPLSARVKTMTDAEVLAGTGQFLAFWGTPTADQVRAPQNVWTWEAHDTVVKIEAKAQGLPKDTHWTLQKREGQWQ